MQDHDPGTSRQKPARAAGVARIVAAAKYSSSGAQRLWREPACRQEVLAVGVVLVLFVLKGVSPVEYLGFAILALVVLATEALNTALEEVVDHLSPEWSAFGKNAKDLGSFAVMCQMIAAGLFVAYVLFT